jgi:2-amino-4-hydroxy-6-hydroxymethyldihydropteridine diphosphokinase
MILVAVGANLPGPDGASPLQTCQAAARALAVLPGSRVGLVSRWYETEPVPRSDQPNYINGVVRLERIRGAVINPETLLASLHAIETQFGRHRAEANAARTMDLDLIDMDGLVRDRPDPILPHPRAHLRAFVLLPLLDVAPDWVHPASGRTGQALLDAVDQSGVRLLTA